MLLSCFFPAPLYNLNNVDSIMHFILESILNFDQHANYSVDICKAIFCYCFEFKSIMSLILDFTDRSWTSSLSSSRLIYSYFQNVRVLAQSKINNIFCQLIYNKDINIDSILLLSLIYNITYYSLRYCFRS